MRKTCPSQPLEGRCKSWGINRKLRRNSQKSNITAKRVTQPPGFLSQGIKSEIVQKPVLSTCEDPPCDNSDNILNENLHGLFQNSDNSPKLRRSHRLSKKNSIGNINASEYFIKLLSEDNTRQKRTPNRSKSIFKQIREKYAKTQNKQEVELEANSAFGQRIFSKLLPTIKVKDFSFYKQQVLDEVEKINNILGGKLDPLDMNRKRQLTSEEDKENLPLKFPYVPQAKWIFQTPPNRKLNFNKVQNEENVIKPAVLETANKQKIVYEMNNKINVNLSHCTNKQEIKIDKRYMVEVATLPHTTNEIFELDHREKEHLLEESSPEKKFDSNPYELENHFLSLTCRPKKTVVAGSKITHLIRKRGDIFETKPSCSTDLEAISEMETDCSFIDNLTNSEESFTFKFSPSTEQVNRTTTHMFDFDGNQKDTFNFQYGN